MLVGPHRLRKQQGTRGAFTDKIQRDDALSQWGQLRPALLRTALGHAWSPPDVVAMREGLGAYIAPIVRTLAYVTVGAPASVASTFRCP